MEKKVITNKLQRIFRRIFQDENLEINDETSARDIGDWDSLKHAMLLDRVERDFKIEFDLDDMIEMKTFGDIASAVYRIVNE